jgi:lipoprotein-anchoring transpeptidase ErfK/SrfK
MAHTSRLTVALTVTAVLLLGATGSAAAALPQRHSIRPPVKGAELLAILNHATEAYAHPTRASKAIQRVSQTRPITGDQTVLPVIAHATNSAHGTAWLRVLLPGRPNSHTGWITARSTTSGITNWQITVRLSTRQVTVLWDGHMRRAFKAVVGKPSTPTPQGRFFVEENVALYPQDVGAPYALALSARSNAFQTFDGGPGQIALHGTNNVGGVPGTAASHGCVRLSTQDISWLANHIGPGTPVTITD